MPAHLIVHADVHDAAGYEEYKRRTAPLVAEHGDRYLARRGEAALSEGERLPRLTVVGFPSYHAASRCHHSPGYQEAAASRQRCSRSALAIVDGG